MGSIRNWSRLVPKSGRAEILELLFRTGIFEILAKTLIQGMMENGPPHLQCSSPNGCLGLILYYWYFYRHWIFCAPSRWIPMKYEPISFSVLRSLFYPDYKFFVLKYPGLLDHDNIIWGYLIHIQCSPLVSKILKMKMSHKWNPY